MGAQASSSSWKEVHRDNIFFPIDLSRSSSKTVSVFVLSADRSLSLKFLPDGVDEPDASVLSISPERKNQYRFEVHPDPKVPGVENVKVIQGVSHYLELPVESEEPAEAVSKPPAGELCLNSLDDETEEAASQQE